jgi:hypothetical protein
MNIILILLYISIVSLFFMNIKFIFFIFALYALYYFMPKSSINNGEHYTDPHRKISIELGYRYDKPSCRSFRESYDRILEYVNNNLLYLKMFAPKMNGRKYNGRYSNGNQDNRLPCDR